MRRSKVRVLVTALAAFVCAFSTSQTQDSARDPADEKAPIDIGLTERTGTALMFLDVEVLDEKGSPMPGLTKQDFRIKINYVPRSIYSVDDLCPCSLERVGVGRPGWKINPDASQAILTANKPYFVLYFDFSQLQTEGRVVALDEARRWVEEVMRPEDRVQVTAYATQAGLRKLTPFTGDREQLLRAIELAGTDPDLVDPFPSLFWDRLAACTSGKVHCYNSAKQDWMHTRRALRALLNYITELDEVPARKILMLFHQNNSIFPSRLYTLHNRLGPTPDFRGNLRGDPFVDRALYSSRQRRTVTTSPTMVDGSSSELVPDVVRLVDQVGGTATASRTVLYPLVCGYGQTWTVNLGANLADYTGGEYNRGQAELATLLEGVGRGCSCIYRIGLQVPERKRSKVFRTKVKVLGRALPSRYRVQYVSESDRWERRVEAVLSRPQDATDITVSAALVPLRSNGDRWDVKLQIGVDTSSLLLGRNGEVLQREWEVAALLVDGKGRKNWDLVGAARLAGRADDTELPWVLHERVFEQLRAGEYEVRAVVRDRSARAYGGARARIELPNKKNRGLAGPLILRAADRFLVTELPLRAGKVPGEPVDPSAGPASSIPVGNTPVRFGDELELVTWFCPGEGDSAGELPERFLRVDAAALQFVGDSEVREAGSCFAVRDTLDTGGIGSGSYSYQVRWSRQGFEPVHVGTTFAVQSTTANR